MCTQVLVIGVLVLIWHLCSLLSSPLLLPSPLSVAKEFMFIFKGKGAIDFIFTVSRTVLGALFAGIIGITVGLIMGFYLRIYDAFEFTIDFLRNIPPVVLFPLFLLVFGIGEFSKIAPIVFAGSFYILISTMYGVRNIRKQRIDGALVLGISRFDLFRKVIFPEALPSILGGLRITLAISLILVIVFEMFVGTSYGIGQRITEAQMMYETSLLYAYIVLTGLLGYTMNKIFLIYEKKKTHWWGK